MIFVKTDGMLDFIARFLGGTQNQEFLICRANHKNPPLYYIKTYFLKKLKCL